VWINGKPCTRVVVDLGRFPTLAEALAYLEPAYFAAKKARKWVPFSEAERKAWRRIWAICNARVQMENPPPEPSQGVWKEYSRWKRWEAKEDARIRREQNQTPRERRLAVLGLKRSATIDQIKAAYRSKARECHPDHGGSDEAMGRINEAYEYLAG